MKAAVDRLDAIVIGTGRGGRPLARAFARAGRRTVIVERDARVGGTCVVNGCTPTKTMIASARVAHLVRRAADYGIDSGPMSVDMRRVRERKRALVERFSGGAAEAVGSPPGLELVLGEARFRGPRELDVATADGTTRRMAAATIVIDTGLRPAVPPIDGLDTVPYLDNRSVMELDALPAHLAIVGGGAVGVEFGQMFRRLGSQVTIVNRAPRLLADEDEDVSEAVAGILADESVRILARSEPVSVGRKNGAVSLEIRTPAGMISPTGPLTSTRFRSGSIEITSRERTVTCSAPI